MLFVFHTHREIKIKLLAVFLAALVPFFIFIFYLFDLWYDTRRQLVIEENISIARLLSVGIDKSFRTTQAISKLLSESSINQIMQQAEVIDNKDRFKDLLTVFQENIPGLRTISVFDTTGKIIATSMDLTDEQKNITISDRPYFQKTLITHEQVRSGTLTGRFSSERIVAFASPLVENNTVQNIAIATYNLNRLKQQMEAIIGDTKKPILLIDQDGHVAFRLFQPINDEEKFYSIATNQHVQNALQGQESVFEFETFPDMPEGTYIGFAAPIGTNAPHWVVVSMQSTKDIFSPLISLQNSMWIILLSALVFSFLLISFILRKIRIIY